MADVGRPSAYRDEFADQARKLCEFGATDMEIASFFEVAVSTVYLWKHAHPDFSEALKVGKDALDDRVERSLYNRAVGYSFESEKIFHHQGVITRADTIEHVPPDPGAAMSWLKNRRGDKWREKSEVDVTVTDDRAALLSERRARAAGVRDDGNQA